MLLDLIDALERASSDAERHELLRDLEQQARASAGADQRARRAPRRPHAPLIRPRRAPVPRGADAAACGPFGDGAQRLPAPGARPGAPARQARARSRSTARRREVDRDMLEKLEAPLNHLLRNAVDHGLEPPPSARPPASPRRRALRIEARHRAGMLAITRQRRRPRHRPRARCARKIVERGLVDATTSPQGLTPAELLEFLFLPGFSTRAARSPRSPGAASGLDVVQQRGRRRSAAASRVSSELGRGTTLPPAAARHALGDARGGGRDRRRALRLPAARASSASLRVAGRRGADAREPRSTSCSTARSRSRWCRRAQAARARRPASAATSELCVVVIGDRSAPLRARGRRASSASTTWSCGRSIRGSARCRTSRPRPSCDDGDAGADPRRRRPAALDRAAAARRRPRRPATARGAGSAQRARASACWWSTTRSRCARSSASCSTNRGYEVDVAVDGIDGWNAVRSGALRPRDHRRRHAAHERHRAGARDQAGRRRLHATAGHDRLLQGSRGGPPARPRGRRQLLPDQEQLPRRHAASTRSRT